MKQYVLFIVSVVLLSSCQSSAQKQKDNDGKSLYIDVHHFGAGNVKAEDVAAAHAKDLATQNRYNVNFIKYWVDEKNGDVYCLSSARDTGSILGVHRQAHGLMPQEVFQVTAGMAAEANKNMKYYLDLHEMGAGNVKAVDVAAAHEKDLAVQNKYGVNFLNYWVDEKKGTILCLSQASDSSKVIQTHKEAHGLLPKSIIEVKEGE